MEKNKEEIIKEIINNIRPYINEDGGEIKFVKCDDNYVFVKVFGACVNCGLQDNTINNVILKMIREKIPEIEGVITLDF